MIAENTTKLNEIQLHLLKMFSIPIEQSMLNDVKSLLTNYFYNKVVKLADTEWDNRNYSNEEMDKWIFEEKQ